MLHINHLTCGYDSGFALSDIDLRVAPGEIMGIIGPNGSGKTTLLRAVTGVLKPRNGEILFEGKNIRRMNPRELSRKIAVVSQHPEIGNMTVEEFVLLGRIPHYSSFQFVESRKDIRIAHEAMALTDSIRLKDQWMSRLSGGERQLTLIARALAQEPKLLLLDEPTSYLDIAHQASILNLLKRLNSDLRLTVMMVLHDLNLAAEYCHRLGLFSLGRIHQVGMPDDVMDCRIIEEVYKTIVVVAKNPLSGKPCVMTVSENARHGK